MSYQLELVPHHDWLGEVPSEWERKKLKFLFYVSKKKNGKNPVGDMLSVSGYRGIEVKQYDDEAQKRRVEELEDYRVVRPRQLVVNTMWLNYAGLGVSELAGYVSPAYRSYDFSNDLFPKYVHHLMRSDIYVRGYTKYMQGVRPNSLQIATDDFNAFPILVPPFETQVAIANFLDHETAKIDILIEKQEQLIKLLEEKRKAVISHAVTKGLNPDVPMKNSGVEWLGEVPEHWREIRFRWLYRFSKRQDYPNLEVLSVYRDYGVVIKSSRDDNANMTPENLTSYQLVEAGDLVINKMKAWQGSLGVSRNRGITSPDYMVFVPIHAESSEFIHSLLRAKHMAGVYRSISNGIRPSQWRIESDKLKQMVFFFPPVEEQNKIVQHLLEEASRADSLIEKSSAAVTLLKERRTALISAAVTGKIDVREAV